jgi:type IV pilus assembly protein PilW
MRLTKNYNGGSQVAVDRVPYGFALGDAIVVVPERGERQCALAQISRLSAPETSPTVQFGDLDYRYNKGELGRNFDGDAARLFNLGPGDTLAFHTWSVHNGVLRLSATNLAGSSAAGAAGEVGQAVADNIVSLKAQYGFDTRAAAQFDPEQGLQVSRWSAGMVDADGDGVSGGGGDYQRVAALRIAVVARARSPERADASGACHATAAPYTVFDTAQPFGVEPVPVTLDLQVEGDTVDWRCYRYRTFETIVPLRNAGWRPSA